MSNSTKWLMRLLAWLTPAVLVAAFLPAQPARAASAPPLVGYAASGLGVQTTSSIANLRSNAIGYSSVNCTSTAGITRTGTAASVSLPSLLTAGAVSSKSQTIATSTSKTAAGSVSVGSTNVLNGLVTATALGSSTSSSVNSSGVGSASFKSTLTGLKVGGAPVSATAAPNTKLTLNLAGKPLAQVVVNQQLVYKSGNLTYGITRALTITISASNALGLPIGTQIILGQSYAQLTLIPTGQFTSGTGYGVQAALANGAVKTGPLGLRYVPCTGGGGTTTLASSSVPSVLSTGAITTTANGTVNPTVTSAVTTTINGTSVLGGLLSVSAIKAATTYNKATKVSTDSSSFVGLKVAGLPLIGDSVAPNTTVAVPGLGSVTFHKVTRTAGGIRVAMLYIVLEKALGVLPTGSVITVGYSQSGTP